MKSLWLPIAMAYNLLIMHMAFMNTSGAKKRKRNIPINSELEMQNSILFLKIK